MQVNRQFSIHYSGIEKSINYRLGVSKNYDFDTQQNLAQQFDLKPNHYFFVVLNNVNFVKPTNSLILATDPTDESHASKYEKEILARCVISAPFVFDRGQSHSVALSQPSNIPSLHIQLLDENGVDFFETNQQEISFTFAFSKLVKI